MSKMGLTSELQYLQGFHHHREAAINRVRKYFLENKLDCIIYPSLPILPCKLKDYREENKWRVNHCG